MFIGRVHNVPKALQDEWAAEKRSDILTPGFLMDILPPAFQKDKNLWESRSGNLPAASSKTLPLLYVPASQTPWIFKREAELDLLRTIAGMVAAQVHPYAKVAVDGAWLVYGAAKLRHEWSQPDRDSMACVVKMFGLGVGLLKLPGDVSNDYKLPDLWDNGINVVVKCGSAFYQGKTPTPIELNAMINPNLALPAKVYKAFESVIQGSSGQTTLKTVTAS